MATKKSSASTVHPPMYTQLVLFPERAEYLGEERFEAYAVSLDHWAELAASFRAAFEVVFERRSARVLLVHGAQGNGKSLFVRTLVEHFNELRRGDATGRENLWVRLAGGPATDARLGKQAISSTVMRRVEPNTGWLAKERQFAQDDATSMRVFLFDDAHKDAFVREWAGLTQGDYAQLKAQGQRGVAIESVAERIVEDCRGDFRRSLFVLLSNDPVYLRDLQEQLDRSHVGLAERVELPLPAPSVKEQIVRTNTNKLNQRSYWFCLDQGGPEEKGDAYRTLMGDRGFIDSFQAISRALAAQSRNRRSGRPANKNLLTLVTLGSTPADVKAFLADHELEDDESEVCERLGVWFFRNRWASTLRGEGADQSRRASLVESEFALRWVALDMAASWLLCTSESDDPTAGALMDVVRAVPSIADRKASKDAQRNEIRRLSQDVALRAERQASALAEFARAFADKGQQRSRDYEPALARRLGRELSKGLKVHGSLKPDVTMEQYEPCALTNAAGAELNKIEQAIRRGCHVIEMTAYLQDDMRGLDAYLSEKVRAYAELLESV